LKSEGKYKFTYGKVEVRAKLTTGGVWPAIWMLGSDYATNTWPGCGEIDMEYKGSEPNVIHGTLHYPAVSPGWKYQFYDYRERRF
jgi:beta-glucanase (GH16 family)